MKTLHNSQGVVTCCGVLVFVTLTVNHGAGQVLITITENTQIMAKSETNNATQFDTRQKVRGLAQKSLSDYLAKSGLKVRKSITVG